PSLIAHAAPLLAAASALDAPVGGEATADLDANLALREARVSLHAGSGQVRIGDGMVPFLGATLVASGTPDELRVQTLQVSLPGRTDGAPTHISATGTVHRHS